MRIARPADPGPQCIQCGRPLARCRSIKAAVQILERARGPSNVARIVCIVTGARVFTSQPPACMIAPAAGREPDGHGLTARGIQPFAWFAVEPRARRLLDRANSSVQSSTARDVRMEL
jgi:hypothetical protein